MTNQDLVIIGNGFDMNHGLDTSYRSFYKYLPADLRAEWEKYLNKYDVPNDTWYNFEEIISIITNECFWAYFDTYLVDKNQSEMDKDKEKYEYDIGIINRIFKNVYFEFQKFISEKNTNDRPLNENLSNIIEKKTQVISFNYTDLIKAYSANIYYIHGSINEDFIVFGYSLRVEYDYIDSQAAIYDKHKLREMLNYVRFLKREHNIGKDDLEAYLEEYLPRLLQSYTGKGGWDLEYTETFIKKCDNYLLDNYKIPTYYSEHYHLLSVELHEEAKRYRLKQISRELDSYLEGIMLQKPNFKAYELNIKSSFNLENIQRLSIIGHGLEADLELFRDLFERLSNLSEVLLFVYKGETASEIIRKTEQIAEFTSSDVRIMYY